MAARQPRGHAEARARGGGGQGGRGRDRAPRDERRGQCPWINSQIIAASNIGVRELLSAIAAHLGQMNLVNLSTAIHRLAKVTAGDAGAQAALRRHPAVKELEAAIASALEALEPSAVQPQSLSNVVWSLATMRLMNWPLLQAATALATAKTSVFKPFEMSTMLWALAKLGSVDCGESGKNARAFFHAAANHITHNLDQFGFRCLATTAWSFATARQHNPRLFRGIATQMIPMVHAANCQEIANTAWAFGTAGFHDDRLFTALAETALLHLPEFKPQELSNLLWGFATNGFFHEGFFSSSGLAAQSMDLQAQHLANILWAFARVQPRHAATQRTALALLPLCISRLEAFKPQEVSSTALAVAKALAPAEPRPAAAPLAEGPSAAHLPGAARGSHGGQAPPPPPLVADFFQAVAPWALPRLPEFSAQSLANLVTGFAAVRVPCAAAMIAAIGQEAVGRCSCFEPSALVHLIKAFVLAPPDAGCGGVIEVLVAAAAQHSRALRPKELQALLRARGEPCDRGQGAAAAFGSEYPVCGQAAWEVPYWDHHHCLVSQGAPLHQGPLAAAVNAESPLGCGAASEFPCGELASHGAPVRPPPPAEGVPSGSGGQPFRCSVKNSFLHFSDEETDYQSTPREGSASQRSSSTPGRFLDEHMDEWHRRNPEHRIQPGQAEIDWSLRHPGLGRLGFDWGAPRRKQPQAPQGMFTEDNEPTIGPLADALAAARSF